MTVTTVVASACGRAPVGTEMCYDTQRSPRLPLLPESTTTQKDENSHPAGQRGFPSAGP